MSKKKATKKKKLCCQQNEGQIDRTIRFFLALAIFMIANTYLEGKLKTVLLFISLILAVTAITGYCCLYRLFGIKTN